jgi:hypothetical protein
MGANVADGIRWADTGERISFEVELGAQEVTGRAIERSTLLELQEGVARRLAGLRLGSILRCGGPGHPLGHLANGITRLPTARPWQAAQVCVQDTRRDGLALLGPSYHYGALHRPLCAG